MTNTTATTAIEQVLGVELQTGDTIQHFKGGTAIVRATVRIHEGPHAPGARQATLDYGHYLLQVPIFDDSIYELARLAA